MCEIKNNRKFTTENFKERAFGIHGNKFNYDSTIYNGTDYKLEVFCNTCKTFINVTPHNHYNYGCNNCSNLNRTKRKEDFIKKGILIHGHKYNYDKVIYVNNNTKVEIYCYRCAVYFWILPRIHLSEKAVGCKKCGYEKAGLKGRLLQVDFIEQCKIIHNNFYIYDLVIYDGGRNKIIIICPVHGEFKQKASNHLEGQECKKCVIERLSLLKRLTNEEFIIRSQEIHKDENDKPLYGYEKAIYINGQSDIVIYCFKCQIFFKQKGFSHLKGRGHSLCNNPGSKSEPKLFFKIREEFNLNNISVTTQGRPKWLGRQSLDIYFPEHNIAIEYQGGQHFYPVSIYGGEEGFKRTQELDERKKNLCIENDCKLFYFTYEPKDIPVDHPYKLYTDEQELLKDIEIFINNERN